MKPTLDDELPAAPPPAETGQQTSIDVAVDDTLLAEVPKFGEPIPMGTYHFRLESFDEKITDTTKEKFDKSGAPKPPKFTAYADGSPINLALPYFMLHWTCQQEPYTGRKLRPDYCAWISQELLEKARAGDAIAKTILKDRLGRFKQIQETVGYKSAGGATNPKDFFSTNPELKIQIGLEESTSLINGQWKADGGTTNKIVRFIPLFKPNA